MSIPRSAFENFNDLALGSDDELLDHLEGEDILPEEEYDDDDDDNHDDGEGWEDEISLRDEENEETSELTEEKKSDYHFDKSILIGKDILQLEVFGKDNVKAVFGECRIGKLVKVNDLEIKSLGLSGEELMKYLCHTKIHKLKLEPFPADQMMGRINSTYGYSLQYRQIEDGPLGVSVEFVPIPIAGYFGKGLRVHYLSPDYVNSAHFELNDIIISVNDINLEVLEKQSAINLLTSTTNRRLVILKISNNSSRQDKRSQSNKYTNANISTNSINLDLVDEPVPLSSETTKSRNILNNINSQDVHRSQLHSEVLVSEQQTSDWRSIRSNYLCKTLYKNKKKKCYDENNYEYLPKYRYTSDLKAAVKFGHRPYKNLVIQSVGAKINIENASAL